jgi:hypothetical protein
MDFVWGRPEVISTSVTRTRLARILSYHQARDPDPGRRDDEWLLARVLELREAILTGETDRALEALNEPDPTME